MEQPVGATPTLNVLAMSMPPSIEKPEVPEPLSNPYAKHGLV
jgi:hypothetical protein